MKKGLQILSVFIVCLAMAGCPSNNSPTNSTEGLKGYIYYSAAGSISRMKMSDQTTSVLFTNARDPDITAKGEILCVEKTPTTRIIYSDLTGANRKSLVVSESYTGPLYKYWLHKPRISYNQQYVVYDGSTVTNPNSYVVDASTGELVLTIGNYAANQPMVSPSWAPDGSIIVCGLASLNNGIYKVSADFTTIQRIDPNLSNVYEPSVSPDGKMIAFIRDGKVYTMGIDGSNPTLHNTVSSNFHLTTWSPDSKYIASVSSGHLFIFDVAASTITEITKSHYVSSDEQLSWRY